jgi:hypothetical protein
MIKYFNFGVAVLFMIGSVYHCHEFCFGEEIKRTQNLLSRGVKHPDSNAKSRLDLESVGYPQTLYFGDTFYYQLSRTNNNNVDLKMSDYDYRLTELGRFIPGIEFIISSKNIDEKYFCLPEIYLNIDKDYAPDQLIHKRGTTLCSAYPLELPPLETTFEHPFWKKLLDKMTPEGIKCTLTIKIPERYLIANNGIKSIGSYVIFTHELLIKSRSNDEIKILKSWYNNVPKHFLPPVLVERDFDKEIWQWWGSEQMQRFKRNGFNKTNGNFIVVGGKSFNPWVFIRDGNRKPPAQICPTSAEGWLELEKQFQPSTLQDEIKWTRLLLEYFDSQNETAQIKKRDEIVNWLKSLPSPQQMSMSSWIAERAIHGISVERLPESIRAAYLELSKAVEPMTAHYHKKQLKETLDFLEKKKSK